MRMEHSLEDWKFEKLGDKVNDKIKNINPAVEVKMLYGAFL